MRGWILLVGALVVGTSACDPEAAQIDASVVDAPVADAPDLDAPVADASDLDAPVADASDLDAPVADAPVVDAPVVDAPVVDAPVADAPVVDAPMSDAPTGTASVLISRVYTGGGMAANGYDHDFVELFNRGTQATSLVGWTLQVRAVGTSTWITWPLTGSIAGNSYVLVRLGQAANPVDGNDLPTPYLTGTAVDIENGTSVALVSSTSAIAPDTCPTGPVDLFGAYIAPCKEAAGFFGGPGYNEAFGRGNVCVDTNDNGADFMSEPISTSNPPRTSSTALHTCP